MHRKAFLITLAALAGLAAAPAPPAGEATAPTPLDSYVARASDGSWIDWYLGRAGATGQTLIIRKDYKRNNLAYLQTVNDAEIDGRRRLQAILGDLASHEGAPIKQVPAIQKGLTGYLDQIKGAVQSDTPGGMKTAMVVKLWGGAGPDGDDTVIKEVLIPVASAASRQGTGAPVAAASDGASGQAATGLIIDATGVKDPAPSLFPRVLDAAGTVLYSLETVEMDYVYFRGMAAYATPNPSAPEQPPVLYPRQGHAPLRVTAIDATGPARTDFVLSAEDGAKVAAAAAAAPFLKECRVLVLMPPAPHARPAQGQQPRRPSTVARPEAAVDPNLH